MDADPPAQGSNLHAETHGGPAIEAFHNDLKAFHYELNVICRDLGKAHHLDDETRCKLH